MNNQTNNSESLIIFFLILALFAFVPSSEENLGNPFIVHCENNQKIFLNMGEDEISNRLGKELDILINETGTYFYYYDLTIRCNDGRVDGIFMAGKNYSILNGVRSGKRVYEIPFINRTIFGLFNIIKSENVLFKELEKDGVKETIEYRIAAKDNLGNRRLLAGEIVDKPQSTYILKLYTGAGKIGTIELYNSIEFSEENRLIHVDL